MLVGEMSPKTLIALAPDAPELEDDRPINEYDRLRTMFPKKVEAAAPAQ